MAGGVDRFADFRDRRQATGGGLVVQDADCLDLVRLVLAQTLLDDLRVGADAPISGDEFGAQAEPVGHHLPQRRELPGVDHQHLVSRRERVDERGFPGAGAGRGQDDHRIDGLEDRLDAFEHALAELGEFRAALVDERHVDRPQDAIGHGRRPGDLQEMAPGKTRGILRHCHCSGGRFFVSGRARPQLRAARP